MVGTDWQRRGIYETSQMSNSKLYVGNLSFKTTEDELRAAFGQFGAVTDVYVAMDKMTGRPRGFAFVTMGTAEEAKAGCPISRLLSPGTKITMTAHLVSQHDAKI